MKVAVCYSGLYREFIGWQENHKFITDHADAVFYSTWNERPEPPVQDCMFFDEPVIDYNPFLLPAFIDKFPEFIDKFSKPNSFWDSLAARSTKQIIAHDLIVTALPSEFDLVIRMRYDTWLGNHNWQRYLQQSYDANSVVSFGNVNSTMDNNNNMCNESINEVTKLCGPDLLKSRLTDFMNIHSPYKIKGACELHQQKQLFPSNSGWYQVLVEPYKEAHVNYAGGIMLSRQRGCNK